MSEKRTELEQLAYEINDELYDYIHYNETFPSKDKLRKFLALAKEKEYDIDYDIPKKWSAKTLMKYAEYVENEEEGVRTDRPTELEQKALDIINAIDITHDELPDQKMIDDFLKAALQKQYDIYEILGLDEDDPITAERLFHFASSVEENEADTRHGL